MPALSARLLLAAFLAAPALPAAAADAPAPPAAAPPAKSSFTPAQREELKGLIRAYLLENPEVISEVVTALQTKEDNAREAKQKKAMAARAKDLRDSPEGTVIGNSKGDVTVVEFFDYNCGYCKSLFPSLMDVIKADGKLRVVLKEFPILGPSSVTASKAALASVKQGKYADFHVAMMSHKGSLSDETVMKIAKDTGLDLPRLQADMKSEDVEKVIAKNHDLARELDVTGTPALVIGEAFVPGAIGKDALKDLIAKARAKS
jgi:protein-disulfide isomerase